MIVSHVNWTLGAAPMGLFVRSIFVNDWKTKGGATVHICSGITRGRVLSGELYVYTDFRS